ncbi:hypothetical protein QCA50_004659 [Cerrena zonata]|uniref:Uncharacterized protein n=1 Tax=Cerrena zonata TaxID=2478898 RepID=A0AAW0GD24_9APHY
MAAADTPGMTEGIAAILQRLNAIEADMQLVKNDLQLVKDDLQLVKDDMQLVKDDMQLVKDDMQLVKDEVRLNNAMIHNQRTITLNQRNNPMYAPLRKTVPGHDLALLDDITTADDRSGLVQPANAHPVGSVLPDFEIYDLTRKQITSYMLFYNEDFGIVGTDDVQARRTKFLRFLTTY